MAKQAQATWGGRFSAGPAGLMLRFSESVSFDHRLAPFDLAGSKAHSAMLAKVGLITRQERDAIHRGLDAIGREIAAGKFKWQASLEDVHMNIEQALTKRVPAAAKLHTARSRNDQVATDVRLYLKAACVEIIGVLAEAQRAILRIAVKNPGVLIPGYTHLQRAQPVYFAHHLLAYVEMFDRDMQRLIQCFARVNVCPLGSGAGIVPSCTTLMKNGALGSDFGEPSGDESVPVPATFVVSSMFSPPELYHVGQHRNRCDAEEALQRILELQAMLVAPARHRVKSSPTSELLQARRSFIGRHGNGL